MMRSILLLLWLFAAVPAQAAFCASPGRDGDGIGLTGVVNSYWPGAASAATGATSISLGAGTGPAAIAAGDLLLVIQMQDAQINSSNNSRYGDGVNGDPGSGATSDNGSGLFEFVRAGNAVPLSGGTLTLVGGSGGGLLNAYSNAAATGTRGQRRFQVIRVPQYRNATLGASLTATRWNGSVGGVLAIDVAGSLNLNGGSATVSGLGFRGGGSRQLGGGAGADTDYRTNATVNTNGPKGEGTAGTGRYVNDNGTLLNTGVEGYPNGSHARGAPGNAGGGGTDGNPAANDENTGGGGGAGYGDGGQGGNAWCNNWAAGTCDQSGGFGGTGVTAQAIGRLLPGGGGGGGTSNNGTGTPAAGFASSGAAGGGVMLLRAGALTGSGTLAADGASANSTITNDASGGGGGGGAILLSALNSSGLSASVSARGGSGGSNTGGGASHGPGGGGGGGFVATNLAIAATVSGGAAGSTVGGPYGATGGSGGQSGLATPAAIPGISSGAECTPLLTKAFNAASIGSGGISRMTLTVTNPNPDQAMSALAFTDTYPADLVNAATPSLSAGCGGSATATAGGSSLIQSGGSLAAGASCSVAVNVTSPTTGARVNSVAAGGLTATLGGASVASASPATATLTVTAPLSATKSVVTVADPFNGTTNPKAIPDGTVEYAILVTNATATAIDGGTISVTDLLPSDIALLVTDLGASGSGPVAFVDGAPASGVAYSFAGLGNGADGLDFSNNSGTTWTYVPVADGNGVDAAVNAIRVRPTGALAAGRSFTLRFRARVK